MARTPRKISEDHGRRQRNKELAQSVRGLLGPLVLVLVRDHPGIHGFALADLIAQYHDDLLPVGPASIYPVLHGMTEAGYLRSETDDSTRGPVRRIYFITDSGMEELERKTTSISKFCSAILRIFGGKSDALAAQ